jgi:hypothetical protein
VPRLSVEVIYLLTDIEDDKATTETRDRTLVLHVLVTPTDDAFEAHCLEMDIVTESSTGNQAFEDCCDLIAAQYRCARDENNLENLFFPAPAEYWKRLGSAKLERVKTLDLDGGPNKSVGSHNALQLQELVAA